MIRDEQFGGSAPEPRPSKKILLHGASEKLIEATFRRARPADCSAAVAVFRALSELAGDHQAGDFDMTLEQLYENAGVPTEKILRILAVFVKVGLFDISLRGECWPAETCWYRCHFRFPWHPESAAGAEGEGTGQGGSQ